MKSLSATKLILLAGCLLWPAPTRAQELSSPGMGEAEGTHLIAKGAMLYSTTCGRCHNMRSSAERTDVQWKIIVSHMRARANMTKGEAQALVAFLQSTNVDASSQTSSFAEPADERATGLSESEVTALVEDLKELQEP